MRVEELKIPMFRGISGLKVQGIPVTSKLVILIGPNGSGKTTVFDAFRALTVQSLYSKLENHTEYYFPAVQKTFVDELNRLNFLRDNITKMVNIKLHNIKYNQLKSAHFLPEEDYIYRLSTNLMCVRSAYRHNLISNTHMGKLLSIEKHNEINQSKLMIENDPTLSENYSRLVGRAFKKFYDKQNQDKTVSEVAEEGFQVIRNAVATLFEDSQLVLDSLSNPTEDPTFRFSKGSLSKNYPLDNLSGGEKAAFDLLLDLAVKFESFEDAIYAIDEPEIHIGSRLQGKLLQELFKLVGDNNQLWIATHSPGMVRAALELYQKNPNEVCFLDFSSIDIQKEEQVLKPTTPTRVFWEEYFRVAAEDLGVLLSPKQIVLCEGRYGGNGFDAQCYNRIFADEFPETLFISCGSKTEVAGNNYIKLVEAINQNINIIRLRDRDDCNETEIEKFQDDGIRVLSRRELENYLFDYEVLQKLCEQQNRPYAYNTIQAEVSKILTNINSDNIKENRQKLREIIVRELDLKQAGESTEAVMLEILVPCIEPDMEVYQELKKIIFPE